LIDVGLPDFGHLLAEKGGFLGPGPQLLRRVFHLGQLQLGIQQFGRYLVHLQIALLLRHNGGQNREKALIKSVLLHPVHVGPDPTILRWAALDPEYKINRLQLLNISFKEMSSFPMMADT
jgi:hypothetical protein